jgi:hypothetical protein
MASYSKNLTYIPHCYIFRYYDITNKDIIITVGYGKAVQQVKLPAIKGGGPPIRECFAAGSIRSITAGMRASGFFRLVTLLMHD